MSAHLVHRPARSTRPLVEPPPRTVEAPPTTPEEGSFGSFLTLLPVLGSAGAMTMMLVFRGSAFAAVGAVVMVVVVLSTTVLVVSQRGRATRRARRQRERYLDHLEEVRDELRTAEDDVRAAAALVDPPAAALPDLVRDPARRWERRRSDADFLRVRLGLGTRALRPLVLRDDGTAMTPTDPFLLAEAQAAVRRSGACADLPTTVELDLAGPVSVVAADREDGLAVLRALLAQVVALHAPDDVALAVARPASVRGDWACLEWAPHTLAADDPEGARLVAEDATALAGALADELGRRAAAQAAARRAYSTGAELLRRERRLLVLHDDAGRPAAPLPMPDRESTAVQLGVTEVHLVTDRLDEPSEVSTRITVVGDDEVVLEHLAAGGAPVRLRPDPAPPALVEAVARALAPLRISREAREEQDAVDEEPPADLLGLGDPADLDVERLWAPRGERDHLRVVIGRDVAGAPVVLDLKEPAQLGMGPHGLCVGATGSGKSELLRTLVLALAAQHPPDALALLLVDYKGGATFAPFADLPHVAGLITNLEDDLALVERAHASLSGEVRRRQRLLKTAGAASVTDYQLLRAEDPALPVLPTMLVVVDEFAELITAEPDFLDLFVSIGRIGRSIGVHLLLASQRLEGGSTRGLDSHLSYRLALRTFSAEESRTVLGTADALELPPLPGWGYLKVDTTTYQRFSAAYVSGPLAAGTAPPVPRDRLRVPLVRPITSAGAARPGTAAAGSTAVLPARTTGPTLLSALTTALTGAAPAVASVWLPPLPASVPLDEAGGGVVAGAGGIRLASAPGTLDAGDAGGPRPATGPRTTLGLLDDPRRQWQGRLELDLTRSGGHALVLGAPGTGRSTVLRTAALGLATSSTPQEVALYGVDLLGGGLAALAGLPHVGGVAGRGDRERVRRTLEEVLAEVELRERVFVDRGFDSVSALRAAHAAGDVPELAAADVVLLLDGYGQLAGDFEAHDHLVHAVLERGGSYGVHVLATAGRWAEVRMAQQAAFGTRLELRLAEPADSTVDRKLARTLRADQPGRVLTEGGLLGQVALPRLDGEADPGTAAAGLERAVGAVDDAWRGPRASAVRVLPDLLPATALPGPDDLPDAVPLGLDEADLAVAELDLLGRDQHLLVLGDTGSGRTGLLRHVARALSARWGADDLVLAVVDPRRGLEGVVHDDHLGARATSAALAERLAAAVTEELGRRGGGGGGPRVVLLVDDYDVLTAGGSSPLAAFLPFLPAAADLGLHVVLARRVAGAARGLYDPLVQAVRESGATTLVLSGDRSEGQLVGSVRARPLPPGRAQLVRLGQPVRTVQCAWEDPAAPPPAPPGPSPDVDRPRAGAAAPEDAGTTGVGGDAGGPGWDGARSGGPVEVG